MRLMLQDVSDIVSTDPDRFGKRKPVSVQLRIMLHNVSTDPDRLGNHRKPAYTAESMFKSSVAHMMGMQSYLLKHFEGGSEPHSDNRRELSDIFDPADVNDRELKTAIDVHEYAAKT